MYKEANQTNTTLRIRGRNFYGHAVYQSRGICSLPGISVCSLVRRARASIVLAASSVIFVYNRRREREEREIEEREREERKRER
jgi:hypothetical protein